MNRGGSNWKKRILWKFFPIICSVVLILSIISLIISGNSSAQFADYDGYDYAIRVEKNIYQIIDVNDQKVLDSGDDFSALFNSKLMKLLKESGSEKTIVIDEGIYYVRSTLWPNSGLHLKGVEGSILVFDASQTAKQISMIQIGQNTSPIIIEGLTIDGNAQNTPNSGNLISINGAPNVIIKDCTLRNGPEHGIYAYRSIGAEEPYLAITGNDVNNMSKSGIHISLRGGDVSLSSNKVHSIGSDSVDMNAAIYCDNISNVTIENNIIHEVRGALLVGECYNVGGIVVRSSQVGDVHVRENVVHNISGQGMLFFNVNGPDIWMNIVRDVFYHGIYVEGSPYSTIRSNTIHNATDGIVIGSYSPYFSIRSSATNNEIIDCRERGLVIDSDDSEAIGNKIINCGRNWSEKTFDYAKSGILCYASRSVIEGNVIIDSKDGRTTLYGISDRLSSGGIGNDNSITNNNIEGAILGGIYISGSGHHIRDNIGFVSEGVGVVTIVAGSTEAVVEHGLSWRPSSVNFYSEEGEILDIRVCSDSATIVFSLTQPLEYDLVLHWSAAM